jgi:hypothetical protein
MTAAPIILVPGFWLGAWAGTTSFPRFTPMDTTPLPSRCLDWSRLTPTLSDQAL